jgi:hypothetical protein
MAILVQNNKYDVHVSYKVVDKDLYELIAKFIKKGYFKNEE